jgi:hypothetical protein
MDRFLTDLDIEAGIFGNPNSINSSTATPSLNKQTKHKHQKQFNINNTVKKYKNWHTTLRLSAPGSLSGADGALIA